MSTVRRSLIAPADRLGSPSWAFQSGTNFTTTTIIQEEPMMLALLASGFVVTSADYEGPNAAVGNGPLMGVSVSTRNY